MFATESIPHLHLLAGVAEDEYKALKVIDIFILQLGRLWRAEHGTLLALLSAANQVSQKGDHNDSWKRSEVL
jgi:hypothetical protein